MYMWINFEDAFHGLKSGLLYYDCNICCRHNSKRWSNKIPVFKNGKCGFRDAYVNFEKVKMTFEMIS